MNANPCWKPIETAPKDGENVLIWDGEYQAVAWYWEIHGAWWVGGLNDIGEEVQPTHWMPLPEPPGEEECA